MAVSFGLIVAGGGGGLGFGRIQIRVEDRSSRTRQFFWGTCLYRGYVPLKLLIGFTEAARHLREADRILLMPKYGKLILSKRFEVWTIM